MTMPEKYGFTSTIPVEIIYAAGHTPVDINNIFVTAEDPSTLVSQAKMEGFPDTTCSWICGLYATIIEHNINTIIGVTGGDCSETIALMEVLESKQRRIIPFAYPHLPDKEKLQISLERFAVEVGTSLTEAEKWKKKLDRIRSRVHTLDRLLWQENKAEGKEIQLYQLSCSDFEGNPDLFDQKIKKAIEEISKRSPQKSSLRLGFVGVPPIISNLYDHLETQGARIVYSEVQRQFSLPYSGSLVDVYSSYTYPYGMYTRLKDIEEAIAQREIDGIIHYVQSFCFRSIEDIILKKKLQVPVLTLQGDIPSKVTETMEIRIEAFLDMLLRKKEKSLHA
jgi:benzoyl-CoA reductase/2-hydroxyglutaryl-CoA dehydratase subunit BcrC/BadD/HgdB